MSNYLGFIPTNDPDFYFISYNTEDADRVGKIAQAMVDRGFKLWYDYGIPYGVEWERVIARKLKETQAVFLFITKGILQKYNSYVQKEYRMAKKFFRKKVYLIIVDQITLDDVPEDKVPWWDEVLQNQCIQMKHFQTEDDMIQALAFSIETSATSKTDINETLPTGIMTADDKEQDAVNAHNASVPEILMEKEKRSEDVDLELLVEEMMQLDMDDDNEVEVASSESLASNSTSEYADSESSDTLHNETDIKRGNAKSSYEVIGN